MQVDPDTGLSTTSSVLEYSAEKEDTDAQFTCITQPTVGAELVSSPVTFSITCESPNAANNIHWTHFQKSNNCCLQAEYTAALFVVCVEIQYKMKEMLLDEGCFSFITTDYEKLILCLIYLPGGSYFFQAQLLYSLLCSLSQKLAHRLLQYLV